MPKPVQYSIILATLLGLIGFPGSVAAAVCTANLEGVGGFKSFAGVGFQENLAAYLSGTLNGQSDNNPGDYQAEIDWEGDGQFQPSDLVPLGNGRFLVKGSHTYELQGTYRPMVKVTGTCGNSVGPRNTVTVTIAPMPSGLPGKSSNTVSNSRPPSDVTVNLEGVGGFSSFAGVGFQANRVAYLSGTLNGQPDNELGDFHAQINWGDRDQWDSADLVRLGNGRFQVKGSHIYDQQGTYPVVVYANGADGTSTAQSTLSVTVSPMLSGISGTPPGTATGALPPSNVTVNLEGVGGFSSFAGVGFQANRVAYLSGTLNGQPDNELGDFHAQINWGDSDQWDSADLVRLGNGQFQVKGSHVYDQQGTYPVVVYVNGADGTSTAQSTLSVTVSPMPSGIPGTPPGTATGALPPSNVTVNLEGVGGFSTQATVGFETNLIAYISGTLNAQLDNEVGDYQVQINWGDSNRWDGGQILIVDSSMMVYGSHVYTKQGIYKIVVYGNGPDGTSIALHTVTATVTPPPVPPQPPPEPEAACLNTSFPITHGPLYGFITEFNNLINSVPGLSDALINGQAISQQMVDDLLNEYSLTKSPYAGLRLIRDALLSEFSQVGKLQNASRGELAASRLGLLVSKDVPAAERRLAATITKTEMAEDNAVAVCLSNLVQKGTRRLQTLTNLKKIAKLKDVERGANERINKIVYELEQIDQSGLDMTQILSDALDANHYSGLAKELTLKNLIENWKAAKAVNALTPDNLKNMRLGKSALLDNGVKLDIDHIIPVSLAPEVGKILANLRLTPVPINRSIQDVVTESVVEYARLMNQAKFLRLRSLNKVEKVVRYVR